MRITRIALHNFMSYEDLDWRPDGARLVCLTGLNGAGKTALASEAISYALYDAARLRGDDLIRNGADEMHVIVEFIHGGAHYRITRGRTRRAGGKSFLELAVRDRDDWRPLTDATIRDTQRRIEELLRLDAGTFGSAVVLAQNRLGRFAEAAPSERKRVLAETLDLTRYEEAELVAREKARELEAAVAAARERVDRLVERIDGQDPAAALEEATADLAAVESAITAAVAERTAAETTLRELVGRATEAEQAGADVRRIEAELAGHRERWQRAKETKIAARGTIARAERALEAAGEVEQAVAALPDARRSVAEREQDQQTYDAARTRCDEARAELQRLEDEHAEAVRAHAVRVERLRDRVAQLEASIERLDPVTCPACAHEFHADPADLRGQLATAQQEAAAVAEVAPTEPLTVSRARAAATRAELALEAIPFDPADLATVREVLLRTERLAARAGEVEAQRAAITDARAHVAAADAEMAAIDAEGQAAREQLATAQAKVQAAAGIVAEKAQAEATLEATTVRLAELEEQRQGITTAVAQAEAQLEQVRLLEAERVELATSIEAGALEVERHRKLAAAFGRDGIPARIIEGTLPELTGHINEVLTTIRPGFSIEMRTQRAKKSGTGTIEALDIIVTGDNGVIPYAGCSGGEQTTVNLAIAIGLSRLVARRAGSRISSLVVDEPDGLDKPSRDELGHALKMLAHRGELERIVAVTHTPDLAEYGDAVYEVSRNGAGSHVELVA